MEIVDSLCKQMGRIYDDLIDLVMVNSDNYSKLYQLAQKTGEKELITETRKYVKESIKSLKILVNNSEFVKENNLDSEIRTQIKELESIFKG